MSSSASDLTTLIAALLAAVPLSYALAALWPARHTHVHRLQSAARCASVLAAVGTLALAGLLAWHGPAVVALPGDGAARRGLTWLSLRLDGVTLAMLLLISLVGFVLVRFSIVYLTGEAGQARYLRWLMATLSAVALLVMANHLLWLAGAWTATSVALHQLLTFYRSRPQALIAAHKKFLISRLADLCLWPALALIGLETGSLELDTVTRRLQTMSVLPSGLETAALLLVIAAALKCAQLPFHGWLTQVMEAPTPVSALLHAGVVNIGGFLMIRLAPLMVKAPAAQTLLVAIATITTVVAALVMTTRVSVKLALAWSTCAQMGLMLLQCGLGAYGLALLHLLAHSCYKAHAFLSAGSRVEQRRIAALAPAMSRPTLRAWGLGAVVAVAVVAGLATLLDLHPANEPAFVVFAALLCAALPSLWLCGAAQSWRGRAMMSLGALTVAALSLGWHRLFLSWMPLPTETWSMLAPRIVIALSGITLLYGLHALLQARPQGRVAQSLYPVLYAGLYLDELFTRLTFRIWPARLPARTSTAPTVRPLRWEIGS